MMARLYIFNAMLVLPSRSITPGSLVVADGRIAEVNPSKVPEGIAEFDAGGQLLTPGLVDIHTHGVFNYCYERSPEELLEGTARLGRTGVTTVLPTLYKTLDGSSLGRIEELARSLRSTRRVNVLGFHLEGPFLALPGAGAPTIPGDLGMLDELLSAAQGMVRAMSISPDCPKVLPVIERLREEGIAVFMTHTRASVEETQAAIEAGARHATHFYDVFPVPDESDAGVRPVGAVETILADDRCTVDFICDGVHVDPMAIRLAIAAKSYRGVIAITDSNIGAGMPEGVYATPWGYDVLVRPDDAARVHDEQHPLHGLLAGSSLTMDRAMSNLRRWLPIAEHELWAMATSNPAVLLGLEGKGVIEVGADADLVLWRERAGDYEVERTWVAGECVYDRSQAESIDHERFVSI